MPITEIHTWADSDWCDVDYSPSERAWVFARLERATRLVVAKTTLAEWTYGLSHALGRNGLYLRTGVDGAGHVCCALQDGRDPPIHPAIVVVFPADGSAPREVPCPGGPAFGQNAVEVVGRAAGWTVYVAQSPTTYWMGELRLDGTWGEQVVRLWGQTSQGFADGPVRLDDVRDDVPGLACPSVTPDGLAVGQNADDGPDRLRGVYRGTTFRVRPGTAFEPHLVGDDAGAWVACARTPQGAVLLALAAPFVPEVVAPDPPDPDPPPPPPDPEPTVIPDHFDTVQAVSDAHPHLLAQNTRETMTELLWRIIDALRRRDPQWGLLSKSAGENHTVIGGRLVGVDALAYGEDDQIVDIFRAAHDGPGTGGLTWAIDERRPSNTRVVPPPFPGGTTPPPDPDPDPPTGTDLTAVHAKLDLILATLDIGFAKLDGPFKISGGF